MDVYEDSVRSTPGRFDIRYNDIHAYHASFTRAFYLCPSLRHFESFGVTTNDCGRPEIMANYQALWLLPKAEMHEVSKCAIS